MVYGCIQLNLTSSPHTQVCLLPTAEQLTAVSRRQLVKTATLPAAGREISLFTMPENNKYKLDSGTHPFNGPLSGSTRVSRYQKGKTNLDFTEARDSEWQWHQLDKSAARSRQITTPAPHHSVFYRQTDRRTTDRCIDPALHTIRAVPLRYYTIHMSCFKQAACVITSPFQGILAGNRVGRATR